MNSWTSKQMKEKTIKQAKQTNERIASEKTWPGMTTCSWLLTIPRVGRRWFTVGSTIQKTLCGGEKTDWFNVITNAHKGSSKYICDAIWHSRILPFHAMCWVGCTYLWAKSYHMMKCWAESLEYLRSHNPTSIGFRFACSQQAATATSVFRTFCACNQIEQFIRWHASRYTHVLLKACFVQWHTAMVWRTQDPAIVATSDTFPGCILFQTIPFFFSARLLCCIMLLLIGPYQKTTKGKAREKERGQNILDFTAKIYKASEPSVKGKPTWRAALPWAFPPQLRFPEQLVKTCENHTSHK